MKNENDIVKVLAHEIAEKITRKTIFALQRIPYPDKLSGDFSGLTTIWDEICVQVQVEESHCWDSYDLTVRTFVEYDVSQLKPFEKLALWFQTDEYDEWQYENQDDEKNPPVFESDIVNYLLAKYVYSEAMIWTNAKIRNYIEQY